MSITMADKASVWPIAQQIVGALTFISNTVKSIVDVAKISFGYNRRINHRIDAFKKECVPTEFTQDKAVLDNSPLIKKLTAKKSNLPEHLKYMGIGIIRFLPVVGTIYSLTVWYKASRIA